MTHEFSKRYNTSSNAFIPVILLLNLLCSAIIAALPYLLYYLFLNPYNYPNNYPNNYIAFSSSLLNDNYQLLFLAFTLILLWFIINSINFWVTSWLIGWQQLKTSFQANPQKDATNSKIAFIQLINPICHIMILLCYIAMVFIFVPELAIITIILTITYICLNLMISERNISHKKSQSSPEYREYPKYRETISLYSFFNNLFTARLSISIDKSYPRIYRYFESIQNNLKAKSQHNNYKQLLLLELRSFFTNLMLILAIFAGGYFYYLQEILLSQWLIYIFISAIIPNLCYQGVVANHKLHQ